MTLLLVGPGRGEKYDAEVEFVTGLLQSVAGDAGEEEL